MKDIIVIDDPYVEPKNLEEYRERVRIWWEETFKSKEHMLKGRLNE